MNGVESFFSQGITTKHKLGKLKAGWTLANDAKRFFEGEAGLGDGAFVEEAAD